MKRAVVGLCALTVFVSFASAMANDDAASLYKSYCQSCHGADASMIPAGLEGSDIEPLKGQSSAEIFKKLEGYKDGSFGGQKKAVMTGVTKRLSGDQLKMLADYAASL